MTLEWVETAQPGRNDVPVGADAVRITVAVRGFVAPENRPALYGDGVAAGRMVSVLTTSKDDAE